MPKKQKTHEEFVAEVFELVGNEYEVIGKYERTHSKIEMLHNSCGYEYEVTPHNFLRNRRCPKCSGKIKVTTESFKNKIFYLVKDEYEVLGKYKLANTKIKMKHVVCGDIFEMTPNNFLSGKRCPLCAGNKKKTTDIFKQEVYELVKNEYEVIGEYVNGNTHIKMLHTKCNFQWEITPNAFLHGHGCPKCAGNLKRTTESFKKLIYDLEKEEYSVLGEYVNSNTKILMKHNACGYQWEVIPESIIQGGTRCPKCKSSKGEKATAKWLDEHNIKYIYDRKYKDCVNHKGNSLKFDFRIYESNGNVRFIEYQGNQHEEEVETWGGKEGLEYRQTNDQCKRDYCEENNIPLLEVWYWDLDNIDQILNKEILPLDLIKQENPVNPLIQAPEQLEFIFN